MDFFSHSALHIATNLVVCSWAYLLSIQLSFGLPPSVVSQLMGNILASGVLEDIAIGLRKQREENSNKVHVCLSNNF